MNAGELEKPDLECLFCAKTRREVKHLIGAPKEGVFICDECVGLCMQIMSSEGWVPPWIVIKTKMKLKEPIECECGRTITDFEVETGGP